MGSALYRKNLELWAREWPYEAVKLEWVETQRYRRLKGMAEGNLKTPLGRLYQEDPRKEAVEWFKSLPLEGISLLYVYGVGLGSYYIPLKNWLQSDPKRHVVFFEDDPSLLKRFFREAIAQDMLQDPQVSICLLKDSEDAGGVLETIYWSFALTPFLTTALQSYALDKKEAYEKFRYKIAYSTTTKNALVDEYVKFGVGFLRNFYPNMLSLSGSYWGNKLFGQFHGLPAIICGAGPSLEKQLPLLASLKDKALFFGGGSALNVFAEKGIIPHFGAGIDPNLTQASRVEATTHLKVPFFYRSRLMHDALKKIRGPKLYISGAGGYDIAEWYDEKLGLAADFLDEGHNVVNFCTELAFRLGCNPIIYVGMDLAFTEGKLYSSGVQRQEKIQEEKLLNAVNEEERGIWKNDIEGRPTLTLWKWVAEADWIGAFAKKHPETTLLNATEGGIGFPDVKNLSLQEASSSFLSYAFNLDNMIEKAIEKAKIPHITSEKLLAETLELRKSFERCKMYIGQLVQELEEERKRPGTEGRVASGKFALAEDELFHEPAYEYGIDIFHQVYARLQNQKVSSLRLNKMLRISPEALAQQKIELQLDKLFFMRDVAEANILLIDYAIKIVT